ncbi:MAG: molybdopterin converting factor subunit 1 [Burkholderiales bacterium]
MKPRDSQTTIVRILYFARLREALGRSGEELVLPAGAAMVGNLTAFLAARGGAWTAELAAGKAVRVAVNQDMADDGTALKDGDEVAYFPPVTGG